MQNTNNLLDCYLFHCTYEKRLSQATIKAYRLDLSQFISFSKDKTEIKRVDKNMVKDFLQFLYQKKLKETSIKRKMISLKAFFSYLECEQLMISNPFRDVRINIKLKRKLPEIMNLDEVKALLNIAKSELEYSVKKRFVEIELSKLQSPKSIIMFQNIIVLELLFSTAMRVNELCNLDFQSVDLVRHTIRIMGKGSKERMVRIPNDEVMRLISLFRTLRQSSSEGSSFLFTNRLMRRLNPQSVRTLINKYRVRAQITKRITPHIFRHTTATMLVENGTDIRIVQSLLGHSSIATTQIYTHVSDLAQGKIIAMNHPRNTF